MSNGKIYFRVVVQDLKDASTALYSHIFAVGIGLIELINCDKG